MLLPSWGGWTGARGRVVGGLISLLIPGRGWEKVLLGVEGMGLCKRGQKLSRAGGDGRAGKQSGKVGAETQLQGAWLEANAQDTAAAAPSLCLCCTGFACVIMSPRDILFFPLLLVFIDGVGPLLSFFSPPCSFPPFALPAASGGISSVQSGRDKCNW